MCICFNKYDTLGEILYLTENFEHLEMLNGKSLKKSNTFLLYSYYFLYSCNLVELSNPLQYLAKNMTLLVHKFHGEKSYPL